MSHQDHAAEVLVVQNARNVLDMRIETDVRTRQMGPFTQPGQGRGMDVVSVAAKERNHLLPAPAAMPRRVDEHEGGAGSDPGPRVVAAGAG